MKKTREMVMTAMAEVEQLPPKDAQAELASGDVNLIDVREPMEFEVHIEGAYQIPRGLLEFVADPESAHLSCHRASSSSWTRAAARSSTAIRADAPR